MIVFLLWITFAILIAMWGKSKSIGFGIALLISLLLSPLVGLIVVAVSSPATTNGPSAAQVYFDDADRMVFKGQYLEAIDKYKDALYEISKEPENNEIALKKKRKRTETVTAKIQEVEALMFKE